MGSNSLTKAIETYINFQQGCVAWRVNNVGIWDAAKQVRRKGNTRKGIADVSAIKNGRAVQIEVKYGKDSMSGDQKAFRDDVIAAGGIYLIAKNIDQFMEDWAKIEI